MRVAVTYDVDGKTKQLTLRDADPDDVDSLKEDAKSLVPNDAEIYDTSLYNE